jgi:AcrR family transcriptional regulator
MPKIVNHTERKNAYTQAAKDVIASKGLESTRLTDVAKILGATTGSLSHYFDDKEDLFDSTLKELIGEWESRLTSEGTLLDVLVQYLPIDESSRRDCLVWIAFYSRSLVNQNMASYIKGFLEGAKGHLANYLHHCEGKSRQEAEEIAIAIQLSVDGLAFRALGDLKNWTASKQRAQIEATVNRLVGKGAADRQYRHDLD